MKYLLVVFGAFCLIGFVLADEDDDKVLNSLKASVTKLKGNLNPQQILDVKGLRDWVQRLSKKTYNPSEMISKLLVKMALVRFLEEKSDEKIRKKTPENWQKFSQKFINHIHNPCQRVVHYLDFNFKYFAMLNMKPLYYQADEESKDYLKSVNICHVILKNGAEISVEAFQFMLNGGTDSGLFGKIMSFGFNKV